MTDRRRVTGPAGPTYPPVFLSHGSSPLRRSRKSQEIRKIFLKIGLTPSASGSAYLELEPPSTSYSNHSSFLPTTSSLKLTCTVHGPRPLPRSQPFSPHLLLSANVKLAPFASSHRRGFIRDASERDLAVHVETALRGLLISERWPKSGVDVIITVLEGEDDGPVGNQGEGMRDQEGRLSGWGMMSVLSGCISVASAAIADAGIDCVDLVAGGVAAIVNYPTYQEHESQDTKTQLVHDPCPSEHQNIIAACVVGYLPSRDEITEIWTKGDVSSLPTNSTSYQTGLEFLMDGAIEAAKAASRVLVAAIKEATEYKLERQQRLVNEPVDKGKRKAES